MARKTPVIPTAFEVPSYSTLVANVGTYLDNELTAAGFSWSSSTRYSLPWILARVIALVLGAVYRFQKYIASGILPSTARDLEQLRLFGEERGVFWLSGERAIGTATVGNSFGVDVTLPAGTVITVTDAGAWQGLKYITTVPTVIPVSIGMADVPVQAESIGSGYILAAPKGARVEDPPAGVIAACILNATTSGGTEQEPVEEYRTRILDKIADPPEGGAIADWKEWARSIYTQNVDNVWVYGPGAVVPASFDPSGYVPAGTVGILYSLDGVGAAKIPSGANVTAMTNYLLAHADRPVTALPKAFAPTDNNVPMTLTLHATSGAVAGGEITALEVSVSASLATMLETRLGGLATPGATSGSVVKNSWIHEAVADVGGIDWHTITSLDGGSGALDVLTTNSWELTRFTTTFVWV